MCAGNALEDCGIYNNRYFLIAINARVCEIPSWNDAPERTHAEVLDAFDRAIALAESENQ